MLRGERAHESDRTIAYHGHRGVGPHSRGIGGVPAGAEDIGRRQQAGDQVVRWLFGKGDQRAVS